MFFNFDFIERKNDGFKNFDTFFLDDTNKAPKFKQNSDGSLTINGVTQDDGRRQYSCRVVEMKPVPMHATQYVTLKVKSKSQFQFT